MPNANKRKPEIDVIKEILIEFELMFQKRVESAKTWFEMIGKGDQIDALMRQVDNEAVELNEVSPLLNTDKRKFLILARKANLVESATLGILIGHLTKLEEIETLKSQKGN